jgi:hypothetical protein
MSSHGGLQLRTQKTADAVANHPAYIDKLGVNPSVSNGSRSRSR